MDRYDPEKKVALVVDEWGTWFAVEPGTNPGFLYQQNTMRDALVAGISLNIFNNHADRVRMANIAQTVNVLQAIILTEGGKMVKTPTYHVFDLYKAHQDAMLLDFAMVTDDYRFGGDRIGQIHASVSKKDGKVNLTLCNLDPEHAADVSCVFDELPAGARITGRVLTGDMTAHNTFSEPERVRPCAFSGFEASGDRLAVKLPSKSVALITIG
jgi:alpha-N-arabinofuranosidase